MINNYFSQWCFFIRICQVTNDLCLTYICIACMVCLHAILFACVMFWAVPHHLSQGFAESEGVPVKDEEDREKE